MVVQHWNLGFIHSFALPDQCSSSVLSFAVRMYLYWYKVYSTYTEILLSLNVPWLLTVIWRSLTKLACKNLIFTNFVKIAIKLKITPFSSKWSNHNQACRNYAGIISKANFMNYETETKPQCWTRIIELGSSLFL